jgi:hypothetical protein
VRRPSGTRPEEASSGPNLLRNNTDVFTDGVLERVRLPDGSLFISAGRADFTGNGPDFTVTPDNGATVNLTGFCVALA